jgi:hypothetical protein
LNLKDFVVDYCQRHAHPANAILHLIGVPVVLYGAYCLFQEQLAAAIAFIALGYYFQYIGHRAQGNEVGEVTLIKKCIRLIKNQSNALNQQPETAVLQKIEIRQEEEAHNQ